MNCPNCGTQLKYVFNMMTICPKCDVVDAHKDKSNKWLESSNRSFWDTPYRDFVGDSNCTDFISMKNNITLCYYQDGIHEIKLPKHKFWIWDHLQSKPFFFFTRNEAQAILRSIKDANNCKMDYDVWLSMHKDAKCDLSYTSNKISFSCDGLSLDITNTCDQEEFVKFLKKYSS